MAKGLLPEAHAILRALLVWLRWRTKKLEEEGETPFANINETSPDPSPDPSSLNDPWSQLLEPMLISSKGLAGTRAFEALIEFIETRKRPSVQIEPGTLSTQAPPTASTKLATTTSTTSFSSSQMGSSIFSNMNRPKPTETSPAYSPAVNKAPPDDPMASGMLDMSAFGMFSMGNDEDEDEDEEVPPPSPPLAPPPSPPPLLGLDTGMLDMSAFGFSTANDNPEEEEEEETPRLSHEATTITSPSSEQTAPSSEVSLFPFFG